MMRAPFTDAERAVLAEVIALAHTMGDVMRALDALELPSDAIAQVGAMLLARAMSIIRESAPVNLLSDAEITSFIDSLGEKWPEPKNQQN